MADTGCPVVYGDAAVNEVYAVQNAIFGFASSAFGLATNQISALNQFQIQPYNFSVSFDVDGDLMAFVRPDPVDDPDITYDPNTAMPAKPLINWPTGIALGTAPVFNTAAPTINIPSPPSLDLPPVPDAPVLTDVVIPPVPAYVLPPVPTMRLITIPDAPAINLPTFDALPPSRNFDVPDFDFDFQPSVYASQLLEDTKARIELMLKGGTGLPAAIEQALFDRAASREDASELKLVQATREEFSCAGFSEPNGILGRRLAEARQTNRNNRGQLNRDNTIDMRKVEVENIRFAVEQGIALENVAQDLFFKQQQLLLDSIKFHAELESRVLDARISVLNADLGVYQALATVFRDLIQAELAKLEVFKAQLDAQRLIGEVNQRDIDLYLAQLKGVDELIQIYKSQIDGANAISTNNNSKVQAFVGLMNGRSETIRGLGFAFDAYKTQVDAEGTKASIFDTLSRAFASRIQAYSTTENLKIEKGRFDVSVGQATLDEWKQESANVVEQLRAEALAVTTKLDVFRGLLERMKTYGDIENTAAASNARAFELRLREAESQIQTQLKNVDLIIDQNEKVKSILLEAMRTAATVGAQLAGSSLSALNASASISHTASDSRSCGTSFSFSGDIES